MRALLLPLLLLIIPGLLPAQLPRNWDRTLPKVITAYFEHMSQGDYDALADLMYHGMFALSPREAIVDMMEEMETGGMMYSADSVKVLQTGKPIAYHKEHFVWVQYGAHLKWTIAPATAADQDLLNELRASFEAEHGSDAVTWDPTARTLQASVAKWMIAVYSESTTSWSFLELDQRAMELAGLVLPEEVWQILSQSKPE
jgi:hypothetical protein